MTTIETTITKVRERSPDTIAGIYEFPGGTTLTIPRESLLPMAQFLRDDPALCFQLLLDVTALDWMPREPRFDVLYSFISFQNKARLRLRVQLSSQDTTVPSLTGLYT